MKNKPKSKRSIYQKWGITAGTLDAWIAAGVDVYNDDQMAQKVSDRQPNKLTDGGTDLHQAKLRKLNADAHRAELQAAQIQKKLISMEEVESAFTSMGARLRAHLLRAENDLSPILEGLTASQIAPKIRSYIERALVEIHDPTSSVWR
jgi:hypothetical protein